MARAKKHRNDIGLAAQLRPTVKILIKEALHVYGAAEEAGIAVFDTAHLGNADVEAGLRQQAPDLGVMAFVQEFISQTVLDMPVHGTIKYHPSLLPRHRVRSAINCAIILGDTTSGISMPAGVPSSRMVVLSRSTA